MALTEKDLGMRIWFGGLVRDAENDLTHGDMPRWLKDILKDGTLRRERKKACLGKDAEPKLMSIMVALYLALTKAKPRSPSEVRKDLKSYVDRVMKLRKHLSEMSLDVEGALLGGGEVIGLSDDENDDNDDQVIGEVLWNVDAVADLKEALDLFLSRAKAPDLETRRGGDRPSPSTLSVLVLTGSVLEMNASLDRTALARLAEGLLGPVIDEFNSRRKQNIPCPDWHDRVGQVLRERG
jgi:hypothetical protein